MKGQIKWIVIAVSLLFCIQAVSAFVVSSITVDPSGAMVAETPVIVSFKVELTGSGDTTFPNDNELQMSTDLEKAKWTYSLVLDGVEMPQPDNSGRVLSVSGWILSYPSEKEESLKVTLEGLTPKVSKTSEKSMIKITEYDAHNNPLTSTAVYKNATIVNPAEITERINSLNSEIQSYRSHIDEKSALGVDTSSAEGKYSEAQSKIDAAGKLPTSQYLQAFTTLDSAQTAIDEGEAALDRAWAEMEVMNAGIPITNVDNIIQWFKANASTANDQQLPAIITKREVAVSYISTANDEISNGRYEAARSKAQEAFAKGNESYTDALKRQYEIEHGGILQVLFGWIKLPKLPGGIILPVVIVVVVLAVVGYVIYRKRSHWDELG
jgi:hypothetical protein